MDLFKRKKQHDLAPGSIWATQPEPVVDYNSVVDWLTGLSSEDYDKVFKVANIYRTAEIDAALALDVKVEPSTFIVQPEEPELEIPFLEDEPKHKKVTKNGKA